MPFSPPAPPRAETTDRNWYRWRRHALRADESFHPKGFSDGSTRRAHWNGTQWPDLSYAQKRRGFRHHLSVINRSLCRAAPSPRQRQYRSMSARFQDPEDMAFPLPAPGSEIQAHSESSRSAWKSAHRDHTAYAASLCFPRRHHPLRRSSPHLFFLPSVPASDPHTFWSDKYGPDTVPPLISRDQPAFSHAQTVFRLSVPSGT